MLSLQMLVTQGLYESWLYCLQVRKAVFCGRSKDSSGREYRKEDEGQEGGRH